MGNRSNINLVGNTTQGQNLGAGDACVFKEKTNGNTLQFRTISSTGDSIQIIQTDEKILISGATGGGSGSGLTTAMNGLTDDGTNVCLGGTLSINTTIDADSNAFTVCSASTICIQTCAGASLSMLDIMGIAKFAQLTNGDAIPSRLSLAPAGVVCLSGGKSWLCLNGTEASPYELAAGLIVSGGSACNASLKICGLDFPSVFTSSHSQPIDYAGDYSTNFGNNSLVTKKWVLDNATGGSGFTIASNGLSANTTTVVLGGVLNRDTTICGSGNRTLNLGATDSKLLYLCTNASQCVALYADQNIELGGTQGVFLRALSGINTKYIDINSTHMLICDCQDSQGLIYGGNYCANYTNRSLVDKEYVDKATSGGSGSYWTKTGTDLCPTTAGDDILLPAGDHLKWGDGTCITSSTDSFGLIVNGSNRLNVNSSYVQVVDSTLYVGGTSAFIYAASNVACLAVTSNWSTRVCGGGSGSATAAGTVSILGGDSTSTGAGGDVCIEAGSSTSGTAGRICLPNLPNKTTETCGIYIDATGKLSKGVISGGTGGVSWNGSTANAVGTYGSSTTIDAEANLTFNGTCLVVTGCACATSNMYAANFILTSDERLKTNIKPISISPIDIEYKQFEFISEPNQLRYGVIAQELQQNNPELVRINENGMLSVSYIDMLVKEVASLKFRICELEKKIK